MAGAGSIFICYRRLDSADASGRIYDRLIHEFGEDNVFKDVDNMPLGLDFRAHARAVVAKTDVFLCMIGPDWLGMRDPYGNRRLDQPSDPVRIEIEAALAAPEVRVIPVFVRNAAVPAELDLPESLRPLIYLAAATVRPDPDFRTDMTRLATALKSPDMPNRRERERAELESRAAESKRAEQAERDSAARAAAERAQGERAMRADAEAVTRATAARADRERLTAERYAQAEAAREAEEAEPKAMEADEVSATPQSALPPMPDRTALGRNATPKGLRLALAAIGTLVLALIAVVSMADFAPDADATLTADKALVQPADSSQADVTAGPLPPEPSPRPQTVPPTISPSPSEGTVQPAAVRYRFSAAYDAGTVVLSGSVPSDKERRAAIRLAGAAVAGARVEAADLKVADGMPDDGLSEAVEIALGQFPKLLAAILVLEDRKLFLNGLARSAEASDAAVAALRSLPALYQVTIQIGPESTEPETVTFGGSAGP